MLRQDTERKGNNHGWKEGTGRQGDKKNMRWGSALPSVKRFLRSAMNARTAILTEKRIVTFLNARFIHLCRTLRQIRKWGIQDHGPFEWLAYTTEELGELSWAISEYEYRGGLQSEVVKEAIQVATLSLKIAEMYLEAPMAQWTIKDKARTISIEDVKGQLGVVKDKIGRGDE